MVYLVFYMTLNNTIRCLRKIDAQGDSQICFDYLGFERIIVFQP